jgi:hypothetical protein
MNIHRPTKPTKGAGEKASPSSRHRHSLLLPQEFEAAVAISGSSPARRRSSPARGRSLSANRAVAHDQMMHPDRRKSSLYRSAPNCKYESNSSSITAQACTERSSNRGHSDSLHSNGINVTYSSATVPSRKFVVELGKDDEILQVFEFSENGSLPPPGTRTTPDKVIVDSILSKRREKHSSHDTDKSSNSPQCEFASSSHFSSQTTATTQTILSSSTNSRDSILSSSLRSSSGGLNSSLRSSSLKWGSRVSLAMEDLGDINNSNRSSSSNRSVRFDIDFDPAPSITEPIDDESSMMTQTVRSMKTLAIKSELESRGVSTDKFIEKNELIDALLKIRREEEEKRDVVDTAKLSDPSAPKREANERHNAQLKIRRKEEERDVVDPADLSDHCAPKGGVNERHRLYATTMTHRQNIPQSTSLKSHFSNLSTNEGTYSVDDDPSIMTDHAVVVMSKPMTNRVQGHTASAGVAYARQNSIIGKILAPSKLHTPRRGSNSSSRRRREDPNSVSVTQNSSAYNQSYDQEQSSQDDGRQSHMRRFFRR